MNDEEHVKSLQDYLSMLKRHKTSLLATVFSIIAIMTIVAFALPAVYQSQATILVEQQRIPRDFVRSTVTTFAAQQVQTIRARVLTVANISKVVEKFGLFDQGDASSKLPATELALMFREEMELELVSADFVDPKSGRPSEVVIAFNLRYNDPSATIAQGVASELVTLFLNENLRDRTDKAINTEEFLNSEVGLLNEELTTLEVRLAEFKMENEGSLPELYSFNLATLDRLDRERSDVRRQIAEMEARKIELSSRLAQLSRSSPVVMTTGEVVLSNEDRLKALQSDYRRKAAIYNERHPDVVRLDREIQTLQQELGVEVDAEDLREQLQEQRNYLLDLQGKYTDDHQSIRSTQKLIALLEDDLRTSKSTDLSATSPAADNPAYVLLDTQLSTTGSELNALNEKAADLEIRIAEYEDNIKRAPYVEKEYLALLRDYKNAETKYGEYKTKQREATVSKNMEKERKGERFILIEPPALPSDPVSPNRPLLIIAGVIFGAIAGLALAFILDLLKGSIHGVRELTFVMGEPPLVAIPFIENDDDLSQKSTGFRVGLAACVAAGVVFVLLVHVVVMPLDILYFVILNKLGLN